MTRYFIPLGLLILVIPGAVTAQVDEAADGAGRPYDSEAFQTPGSERGWFAPTTPGKAAAWLAELSEATGLVALDTLAAVRGDPVEVDSTLPVLLATVGHAARDDTERVRVLVLSGQRGDEPSGLEVSLETIRDLTVGGTTGLLEDLEVAFVPAVNPWGLLWWVREEPGGVDPSRDHAALESAASLGVHDFVVRWRPHLVIELREIAPTVYRVQAGFPTHPNADPQLAHYGRFYLLPYVANELAKASIAFREHVAVQPEREGRSPLVGGAAALPAGAVFTPGPLGANRARNSLALGGSLAVMLGVASLEGVEGLGNRVAVLHVALKAFLEVTAGRGAGLRERVAEASGPPRSAVARDSAGGPTAPPALSLQARFERDDRRPELSWLVWSERGTIVRQSTDRWRSAVRRLLALSLPAGWALEPEAEEWADLLMSHGFQIERLRQAARVEVGAYPVGLSRRLPDDLASDLPVDAAPDASALLVRGERDLPRGTWIVRSDQVAVRLLFTLLEPWSQDAPLARESEEDVDVPGRVRNFLYPVYRLDSAALSRLRTEPVDRSEMPDRAPG